MKVLTDEGLIRLWKRTKQTIAAETQRATYTEEEIKSKLEQYLDSSSSSSAYPYLFFSWGSGSDEYHYEEIAVKEGEIIKLIPMPIDSLGYVQFNINTTDQAETKKYFSSAYCDPVYLTGGPYTAHICAAANGKIIFKATLCDEIPSGTDSNMIFKPTASTTE